MDRESAISRNIILAILVSVAIIVVAVVVVIVIFPPQPDVVPEFNANIERSGNIVYIYHDGGDPLQEGRTIVAINGQEMPPESITFLHSQNWPWTAGKTLRIQFSGPGSPEFVQIFYSSGSTQEIVYASSLETPGATPIPISTRVTTPVPTTLPATPLSATPSVTLTGVQPTASTPSSAPRPPVADFDADPESGQLPLNVQFLDRSTGSPDSWVWNFGDGESSTLQNPSHTYQNAGSYTVTLTATNAYGSSRKTKETYISAGSLPLASFSGMPAEGPAPLEVQFNDLSTGSPDMWVWDFGDGTSSTDRNPIHTYFTPGTYTVTLTVSNQFGTNTRIQTDYTHVNPALVVDVYLTGSRSGYMLPDGYLQFTVKGTDGSIKIAGTTYPFQEGDMVQLFPGDIQQGEIDVNTNGITRFAFDNVRLFVNSELVRTGIVSDINVPEFQGLTSTFVIVIPPGDVGMTLFAGGQKIFVGDGQTVTITRLREDALGRLYYSKKIQDLSYRGGAESYSVG